MNFDECVAEIEALSGELVKVEILGPQPDRRYVAEFWGILGRMGDVELSGELAEVLANAEVAASFVVGDGMVSLLPSRFVGCRPAAHRPGWLEVDMRDATIRIGPKRPAWFD